MPVWPDIADLNIDQTRLVELTDSVAAPRVVDAALVERLRVRAVGILEGHMQHYLVPLTAPIPPIVNEWALAVWRYLIYAHRPEMNCPERVVKDYDETLAMLMKVANEQFAVPGATMKSTGLPPSRTAGGLVEHIERRFGRNRDGLA